jgi:hypothetical protein
VGDVAFARKFPGKKESCEMMPCQDATAISFVINVRRGEVLTHFHAVTIKVTVVYGIDCLDCHDEFFMNNLRDIKENDEHAPHFALHLSALNRAYHSNIRLRLMLSSLNAWPITVRISDPLFLRCVQNLMHLL